MPLGAVGRIRGVAGHERCQVGLGRDRADAGAAAAVRDAEGLVQVQVRDVAAEHAGLGQPDQGVEVGAVDVDLAAGGVDRVADLADVGVVHPVRGRVGDHDAGQRVLVQLDLGVQVRVVDRAVRGGGDDDDLHAGEHGGGRVGAVRGGRDQADVALGVAAGEVVAADGQQAGELALGSGVRLDGDLVVAGDLGQLGFEVLDQFAPAGGLGFRGEGVDGGELRPGDGFHLGGGVQLHGARAQRDHGAVQGEVAVREAADVAQQLGLGAVAC